MEADKEHELIDVLDENGIKTGEILPRGEIHKRGLWHRMVVVVVVDKDNRVLLQQRSSTKKKNPNMWDISATGHVTTGQDSMAAAACEVSEEVAITIGFEVDVKKFRYMTSYRTQHNVSKGFLDKQFNDFFVYRLDNVDVENIKFQKSEVQALKLVDANELMELIDDGQLVERPILSRELINYLFRM